jgi:omega-6 fatty acid desaturase (delta-12 desaturase)
VSPQDGSETAARPSWRRTLARYARPTRTRSAWQLANSLIPYFALWAAMIWAMSAGLFWVTLALAVPAAGFLVRSFIIFHDCAHGSFFRSRRANTFWGVLTGVLIFTPFQHWQRHHAVHHATSGDLDQRGTGDIWTMTVSEYVAASRSKRLAYRIARNPLILFFVAGPFLFLVHHRIPARDAGKRERRSVHVTNAGLLSVLLLMSAWIGLPTYLTIQLSVMVIASAAGVWLFYVQHQFEGVYWERSQDWDFVEASLNGSSFYRLPRVLQWFSGNIGFHHVHHLSPAVPNYNLEKCHREERLFQSAKTVTLWTSAKSLSFRLWDEQRRVLVGFGRVPQLRKDERRECR